MKVPEKTNVAIIVPGGLGTGKDNIGVPVLEDIVQRLSNTFDITIFSLFKVNPDYHAVNFKLISIDAKTSVGKTLRFFWTFYKAHRRNKFRIVHGYWALPSGLFAVMAGKILGIKNVVSLLGGDSISLPEIGYGQLQNSFSRRVILSVLSQADAVVFLTAYMANNLRKVGFVRKDFKIIQWGSDIIGPYLSDRDIGHPVQFLYVGNFSPVKDPVTLLKAFKIIHTQIPSVLTIIGEGILEKHVRQLINELQLFECVKIEKQMSRQMLLSYYQRVDILLHTSLSEGQCMVVTEAMSLGLLVCCTAVGIAADEPSCCFSVPPRDYNGLARGVLELIADPERMDKIRKNAYAWTSLHTFDWTVQKLTELYSLE
jgi:glycosyltransferase involved in cell wall biosynthesis